MPLSTPAARPASREASFAQGLCAGLHLPACRVGDCMGQFLDCRLDLSADDGAAGARMVGDIVQRGLDMSARLPGRLAERGDELRLQRGDLVTLFFRLSRENSSLRLATS